MAVHSAKAGKMFTILFVISTDFSDRDKKKTTLYYN